MVPGPTCLRNVWSDGSPSYCDFQAAGGVETRVRLGHAASVLLEETGLCDADLIVVGKYGASALDERLLGSVTLNVLHHSPCDVLLVP